MTDAGVMEGSPAARHWGIVGTLAWGIGIAIVFAAIQSIAMIAYLARANAGLTVEQMRALAEAAQGNGLVISLATLLTATLCVPLVLAIAKLKRGSRLGDYMAVRAIPRATLARWLGITALAIIASDALTLALGKPVVPDFLKSAYASADPTWLIWLALVVGAPLFEEIFFRGFLFKGLEASIRPVGAIVATAALWSAVHVQYDLYGIGTLFVIGLLLGAARWRTGSIGAPLAMHALANAVACTEAAVLAHRVV